MRSVSVASGLALLLGVALAAPSRAAQSCSAHNAAGQSCTANCNPGETAVCKSRPSYVSCDCNGGSTAPAGDLDISGSGSGGSVRVEALDLSCAALPCSPSLVAGVDVPVAAGTSAADFAQDAASDLEGALGGVCAVTVLSGASDGIRLSCGSFYPSYRICDAALGSCPEDLTPGTGTTVDSGVNLAGFSFDSPTPALFVAVPALGLWGLVALSGSAAWLARSPLRSARRRRQDDA
jgi:hypothetical protein